jgi:glycosyltransferase involved in cell wall biosynthesis
MHERVSNKSKGLDVPIVTIPNWADLDAIEPSAKDTNKLLRELGINDKFVLMYAGNIGHPTDIETIIEAADRLRGEASIHFVFVGSGAKSGWLEKEVRERGLDNVSVLGQLPREDQNTFLNACDVGLVSLIPGMIGTAMPSRTYNILAAGKPIIALTEPGSELAQVIDEENVGWHTVGGDPVGLIEIIHAAMTDRKILRDMGNRARHAAETKYSPQRAIGSYGDLFR